MKRRLAIWRELLRYENNIHFVSSDLCAPILYNASGMFELGEAFHFAVGICNADASVNEAFEHYGVKVLSYNKSTIFTCNTDEFLGSDQCKTIYKIVKNQPVSTKIPIGIYTGLTFDGKYIFNFDRLPLTNFGANSGVSSSYVINVYAHESEALVHSYPLAQSILKGYEISPYAQALTVDGCTAAFLCGNTSTIIIVHLDTADKVNFLRNEPKCKPAIK